MGIGKLRQTTSTLVDFDPIEKHANTNVMDVQTASSLSFRMSHLALQ